MNEFVNTKSVIDEFVFRCYGLSLLVHEMTLGMRRISLGMFSLENFITLSRLDFVLDCLGQSLVLSAVGVKVS